MSSEIEYQRAMRDYSSGNLDAAAQACQAVLDGEPGNAAALHLLGQIARRQGDIAAAIGHVQAALAVDEGFVEARCTLGELYACGGDVAAAEAQFQLLIAAQPGMAMPWIWLGNAMRLAGLSDEAISAYREAISREPGNADAWAMLGMVFLDRGQVNDAMMALKRAIKKRDDHVAARNALAVALQRLGRADEAIANLQASIDVQPDEAASHKGLGDLLFAQGRLAEAHDALRRALDLSPELASAHFSLGKVQEQSGELEQAAASYARVIELQPDADDARLALLLVQQRLCDWDAVEAFAHAVDDPASAIPTPPFAAVSLGLPASRQLAIASRYAETIQVGRATPPLSVFNIRPITLAYLSGDFRDNAVGRVIASILENHDRSRFRVAVFSYGPDDDSEVRRRVRGAVDEFVEIRHHSNDAAVREIRTRGVQILVDLAGYGSEARPQIVAPRAAPIQVGYLGYRGTLGADFNDYIVVDDYLVPAEAQGHYREQPLRMPRGIFVADPPVMAAVTRADCGLAEGALVFCCFNDTRKIGREIFGCWMQLLQDVPGSLLWLRDPGISPSRRLRAAAGERGIDPQRLVFAPVTDRASYLGRYAHADLFLDTYPCNAGSTAIDALLGGCPLLTCSGDSYVSRTAGSVLHRIGMDELICANLGSYAHKARELADTPTGLGDIRARLQRAVEGASFHDARGFTADLEAAFERMLQAGARGEPPAALRPAGA